MSLNRNSMSNLNLAYNTELNLGNNQYQNSLNPQNTNVIPRQYNQQIYNLPQNYKYIIYLKMVIL